jgi:hypothetical protein
MPGSFPEPQPDAELIAGLRARPPEETSLPTKEDATPMRSNRSSAPI